MWPVPNPDVIAKKCFRLCLSGIIEDGDLRERLKLIEPQIIQAEKNYVAAAKSETLHLVATSVDIAGVVTNKEMVKLYNQWMVNSKGRQIYDQILAIPKFGRCPYCGHRKVSTLDHMLSKTQYSELTVTPKNLVACCKDCNKIKPGSACINASDAFLHAYYDSIDKYRWLYARFSEPNYSALEFFINPHKSWSADLHARAENQFNQLDLNVLYKSNAAEELLNIRDRLNGLFNVGGLQAVKVHLEGELQSRKKARLNSWLTATYDIFAQDNWFCNRGFLRD